jgi:hypothetical protein
VRGPLFLPELRHLPPPGAPLMITSQHPPRIVIQTPKNDLGTAVSFKVSSCESSIKTEGNRKQFRSLPARLIGTNPLPRASTGQLTAGNYHTRKLLLPSSDERETRLSYPRRGFTIHKGAGSPRR